MSKVRKVYKNGSYCDFEVINPHAPGNRSNMAVKVAKRITSKFNQHITAICVGGTGTGKSWAAMDLAYQAAREVAKITYGKDVKPDSWMEFFNLDHMAIITLDRVVDVWKNIKPHGIYILDDIGVGYSNRDWMKDKNKSMNKIIQTMRTDNTFVIYTVPHKGLIDKVPRELVEWYFEFERSEQMFSMGLNTCKFLDITSLKRENKQLFVYDLVHDALGREQFVRHVAQKPPDILSVPYEKLRMEIAKELREEHASEIGGNGAGECEMDNNTGLGPSELKSVERYIEVNALRKSGTNPTGLKIWEACDAAGIDETMYNNMRAGKYKRLKEFMNNNNIALAP